MHLPTVRANNTPRECVQIHSTFFRLGARQILFICWICFPYRISTLCTYCVEISRRNNKISFFWVVDCAISSGIFRGAIICDRDNQVFVSNSSLLRSSDPFNLRSRVTDLIECTCSTTMELSFRIRVS